jgi:hypothetical protein
MTDEIRNHFYPCGCLVNSRGAHHGDCPDYETVRTVPGSSRLEDMRWKPRAEK